jgi:hypothetical protein
MDKLDGHPDFLGEFVADNAEQPTEVERLREMIRNAFIMGIASTVEGFNGECLCAHLAPSKVANVGDQMEPDLWALSQNPAVSRLADLYVSNLHCLPNAPDQRGA